MLEQLPSRLQRMYCIYKVLQKTRFPPLRAKGQQPPTYQKLPRLSQNQPTQTGHILKERLEEGLNFLTHLFNAVLRTNYVSVQWKVAQIIMIPKPGKDLTSAKSYRPVSLLSVLSKVFEKLILQRVMSIIYQQKATNPQSTNFDKSTQQSGRYIE